MSDDGCCDTGGDCSYDIGGGCDDSGGGCMETSPCTEATTFSDSAGVCFDQPYETYDGSYCYEDTYRPVYSNLSRNNDASMTDPKECECLIVIVIYIVVAFIICKLNTCGIICVRS